MKIHAIILARGGSKGIKNKNLIILNKKPLIYWSVKSAKESKLIDYVWVSSDSKKILNYAKKIGAKTIKRSKKLSTDTSTSESAWLDAIGFIKRDYQIDIVVGIQPTSPVREKKDFDNAIKHFVKNKFDSLFSSTKIKDYFVWEKDGIKLNPLYDYKNRKRRQDIKTTYLENGSFYIFKKNKFLKYQNRLMGKIGTYTMNKTKSFQIDTHEDIFIVNLIMKLAK
jgi:CMP-N,N'-diacetyllegionaminic acid synthase